MVLQGMNLHHRHFKCVLQPTVTDCGSTLKKVILSCLLSTLTDLKQNKTIEDFRLMISLDPFLPRKNLSNIDINQIQLKLLILNFNGNRKAI